MSDAVERASSGEGVRQFFLLFVVDGSEGEWHGRRRRTFVEQTVRDARHCLHHSGIVVGVLAHFVQSVEDAQRREHAEDLCTISRLFDDRIVEEIEL